MTHYGRRPSTGSSTRSRARAACTHGCNSGSASFHLIGAALYNLIAGWVGGIEIELE